MGSLAVHTLGRSRTGESPSRLILLHGFTQNSRCWGPFADLLAADHNVIGCDLPGHGSSGHGEADLWHTAEMVAEAAGPGIYCGYSMGARVALHLALAQPESVDRLVLIGAHPGIIDPAERAERRASDRQLAARLRTEPLYEFLQWWLAQPLFVGLTEEQQCLAERLTNRAGELADSLESCGTGFQEPLWNRLVGLDIETLVFTGERDRKFTALGQRLVDTIGAAGQMQVLPEAGHALHLEDPFAAAAVVREFIARTS